MPGRSIRIVRIAGIPVGISPWWLLIVALFTWALGDSYYPSVVHGIAPAASYGLGLLSILLLFASVLAHEFGHALVARRRGIEVVEIDLWLLGGVSRMRGQPAAPGDELRYAAAGPAVTAVIAAVFGAIALALPASAPAALRAVIDYQAFVNTVLLFFNLVPAFPLDGGRIARAALWARHGDLDDATAAAARLGRVLGWLMVALGVLIWFDGVLDGLLLAMIGGFVTISAGAEQAQEEVIAALRGIRVSELMSAPAVSVRDSCPVSELERVFEHQRVSSLAVIDAGGREAGLLSIDALQRATRAGGGAVARAGELADRDPELLVDPYEEVSTLLAREAFARAGRAVVIDAAHRPVGVISITDVRRAVRIRRLRDGPTRDGELVRR